MNMLCISSYDTMNHFMKKKISKKDKNIVIEMTSQQWKPYTLSKKCQNHSSNVDTLSSVK
jgi:hypothetical protein